MNQRIVVVGSLNMDLVAKVPRMPVEGETVTGLSFATYPGGKGANQAAAAAKLGADVRMIGRLGDDAFAKTLRDELHVVGVSTSLVKNVTGSSGTAVILLTSAGHNSIVVTPGANAALRAKHLDAEMGALQGAGILLAQLEVPLDTVEHLGRIAQKLELPFMLDPAPAQKLSTAMLQTVTWLTPNETETRLLLERLGHNIPEDFRSEGAMADAASHLLHAGVRNVILKLGERGVYLAGQDVESALVPAFEVTARDTTAAGDAFNGGFAFALTSGKTPHEAAEFGCAVAAISVTRPGAQPSMPTLAEVSKFLAERES